MLALISLIFAREAAGTCTSAVDCNAPHCLDCTCTDGSCVCAGGWAGERCEQPFCRSRTDCHDRGSCVMGMQSITCKCDAGWEGQRCGTRPAEPEAAAPQPATTAAEVARKPTCPAWCTTPLNPPWKRIYRNDQCVACALCQWRGEVHSGEPPSDQLPPPATRKLSMTLPSASVAASFATPIYINNYNQVSARARPPLEARARRCAR